MRRPSLVRSGGLLLILVTLGLTAVGCGDDGGPTTDPPDETTSETTPLSAPTDSLQQGTDAGGSTLDANTMPVDPDTADVNSGGSSSAGPSIDTTAEAAPVMLTVDDLPSGYSETPYESENADCLGPALDPTAAAIHLPNAFEADSVAGEARSRAWDFASEEEAQAAFAVAVGDEIEACIIEGAETDLQTEDFAPGGTAEAQPLELEPVPGADDQASTTFAATFTPASGERELTAYSNLIVVRAGETVAVYQFLTLEQPFSPADQQLAVAAAVARDAAAA